MVTSGIDEDGGLKNEHRDKPERHERPTRLERHETQPLRIPEHHDKPEKATNETTQDREGETKTSEKSERPKRSESPNNLTLSLISSTGSQSAVTNQKEVIRVQSNLEARAASTWEAVKDDNAPEKRCRRKKGV